MNEQVMIYAISESASSNASILLNESNNFFYWNNEKFKKLKLGDYVFVINKTHKYVLLTILDKIDINTSIDKDGNKTSFKDKGLNFTVDGTESNHSEWNNFIRLKIIHKAIIPLGWQWKNLGAGGTTYINGDNINLKASPNRIKNINELKELSDDTNFQKTLNVSLNNFTTNKIPIKLEKKQRIKNEMNHFNEIETAIQTKPFIILAGISGTGKSRLVRELAFKTCNDSDLNVNSNRPGNYELIPVKPNWHDSSDLLGYISRINGEKYISTPFLKFIVKAWRYPKTPFFLCLDEMNLAPIEQYFAEYLSIIETRSTINDIIETDAILDINSIGKNNIENFLNELDIIKSSDLYNQFLEKGIQIPNNLVVMGTVNMDETAHSFSRKVLDRAMTIEMNNVDLNAGLDLKKNDLSYPKLFTKYDDVIGNITIGAEVYEKLIDSKEVIKYLTELNDILQGSPFKIAYRVRDEFLIYCYHNSIKEGELSNALDQLTVMKVLSRIEGDESKVKNILDKLYNLFTNKEYSKSIDKTKEMINRLEYGYTSFWS
jgi:hypothetical protein